MFLQSIPISEIKPAPDFYSLFSCFLILFGDFGWIALLYRLKSKFVNKNYPIMLSSSEDRAGGLLYIYWCDDIQIIVNLSRTLTVFIFHTCGGCGIFMDIYQNFHMSYCKFIMMILSTVFYLIFTIKVDKNICMSAPLSIIVAWKYVHKCNFFISYVFV